MAVNTVASATSSGAAAHHRPPPLVVARGSAALIGAVHRTSASWRTPSGATASTRRPALSAATAATAAPYDGDGACSASVPMIAVSNGGRRAASLPTAICESSS